MKIKVGNDKWQLFVCVLFILLTPFEHIARIEEPLYIILIIALLPSVLMRRTISKSSICVVCFLFYSLLCCIWSPSPNAFSGSIIRIGVYLFLFLQLQFEYGYNDFIKIKRAFIVQGIILAFLCIAFGTYSYGRLWVSSTTSGADPNYLSEWFLFPLVFICEELINNSRRLIIKLLLILELVIIFAIVFLTASRSGFVTSTAAVLLAMLFSFKKNISRRPLIALLVVIIIVVGIYFATQYIPETLINRITGTKSLGQRGQIWSQLLLAMREDWIKSFFGFGDNATVYYNNVGLMYGMVGLVAHNTFLDVLFNYGVIGFTCFMYMIIHGIKKRMKKDPYVVIGSLIMCVSLFSLSALSTRPIVFMLFLLLCNVRDPQEIVDEGHEL